MKISLHSLLLNIFRFSYPTWYWRKTQDENKNSGLRKAHNSDMLGNRVASLSI